MIYNVGSLKKCRVQTWCCKFLCIRDASGKSYLNLKHCSRSYCISYVKIPV